METCIHCGKIHRRGALYCPETGKPLAKPLPEEQQVPSPISIKKTQTHTPLIFLHQRLPDWAPIGLTVFGLIICLFGIGMIAWPARGITNLSKMKTTADLTRIAALKATLESSNVLIEAQADNVTSADQISTVEPTINPATLSMTPTFIPDTPIPTESIYTTKHNPKDGAVLVFVEGGEFTMGADASTDPYFWGAESPSHVVNVDSFWIYQTEVTNAQYQQCVSAKACPLPDKTSSYGDEYFSNSMYSNYPVIYVNWIDASAYCNWAGARLPREAEWEKAARGTDGRLFPWGNSPASGSQANFCDSGCPSNTATRSENDGYDVTAPVGSYPSGASVYGVLDAAGNVWEWVNDWFSAGYSKSMNENPSGPANGSKRVIRGGGWSNPNDGILVVQRIPVYPTLSLETLGFRCLIEEEK